MRVNVDSKATSDPRFKKLGMKLGRTWQAALGHCIPVWMHLHEARTPLASRDDIDALAELAGFAEAMLAVNLATVHSEPILRVRGVDERLEFLRLQDSKREKALEAKRRKAGLPAKGLAGMPQGVPGDAPRDVPISLDQATPRPHPLDLDHASALDSDLSPAPPADWRPDPFAIEAITRAGLEIALVLEAFRSQQQKLRKGESWDEALIYFAMQRQQERWDAEERELSPSTTNQERTAI